MNIIMDKNLLDRVWMKNYIFLLDENLDDLLIARTLSLLKLLELLELSKLLELPQLLELLELEFDSN